MKIIFYYIIALGFILFSCNNIAENVKIKKVKYKGGSLKIEQEFLDDTIQNGFYREYFENGILKKEASYILNKKEGVAKYYRENGTIICAISYKNDTINGLAKWFYESGNIKEIVNNYYDEKIRGAVYKYYDNGMLEYFLFYKDNEPLFSAIYDYDSLITNKQGSPILRIYTDSGRYVHVNKFLNGEVEIVTPPFYKSKLLMREESKVHVDTLRIVNDGASFKYLWKEIGEYRLVLTLEIQSINDSNNILKFEYPLDLIVEP